MKMTIDFIQGICFGISKNPNWIKFLNVNSIQKIIDSNQLKAQFEQSLVAAIDNAYINLAKLEFKDLDSETVYVLKFDNMQKKWSVEIKDSKDAEVSLDEKTYLFKDEIVLKTIKYVSETVFDLAADKFIKFAMPMIEAGNFMLVDEAKAEAVRDSLEDRDLRTAFEKPAFIK